MNSLKNERGGSLIEFVLIAPFLFLLLFGIIEFGLLLHDRAIIINASREGARAGIVFSHPNPVSQAKIEQVVTEYCDTHLLISFGSSTPPILDIDVDPGFVSGDPLTVTVNYSYQFLVFSNLLALVGGGPNDPGINLTGLTVMRME
jgi:Flp pilus assembly protein TadG